MSRVANGIAFAALAVMWAASFVVFDRLPERIPTHFGVDGVADAWSDRSALSWYLVPLIGLALSVMMTGMTRWVAAHPERMNLPGKEKLADIPERHRGPIVEVVRQLMAFLHLETIVIMCMVQRATWVGAFGGDTRTLMFGVLALALLSSPILVVFTMLRMQSAMDAAAKRARAEGWEVEG